MRITIIKKCYLPVPRDFTSNWVSAVANSIKKVGRERDRLRLRSQKELVVVFVDKDEMKTINRRYRNKNKVTDVLSFESSDPYTLGELVICLEQIKKQSKEHGLSLQMELGYMLIHGVLHLLGYEHEGDPSKAKRMFRIQDEIFENLRKA